MLDYKSEPGSEFQVPSDFAQMLAGDSNVKLIACQSKLKQMEAENIKLKFRLDKLLRANKSRENSIETGIQQLKGELSTKQNQLNGALRRYVF